jgi:putative membrane protein
MSKRNTTLATAFFAGLLALAPAFGQNQGATTGSTTAGSPRNTQSDEAQQGQMRTRERTGPGQLSSQDQKFIMEAAAGGMEEVELGRLAVQKAASTDVKNFGQRMVDDHGKANAQLKSIAAQKGVTLPAALPADKKRDMDHLSKLSGAEFDKMYMSHMLKDHKKDVSEFEKQASKGNDSSVKSFAQQTLPTLREHMKMAQSVAGKVGASEDHAMHGGH